MKQERPYRRVFRILGLVAAFASAYSAGLGRAWGLDVAVNEQYLLAVEKPVERVSVGSGDIVNVQLVGKDQIRILGIKSGTTDLIVWTKSSSNPAGVAQTYSIRVLPDLARLRELLKSEPAFSDLSIDLDGVQVLVRGSLPDVASHDRALSILKSALGKSLLDLTTVRGEQTVSVDLKFASVSVTALKELGLNYQLLQKNFQSAGTNPGSVSQFNFAAPAGGPGTSLSLSSSLPLSDAFNLFFVASKANLATIVSALNSVDAAQFLAEPTLIVRSGRTGTFLAGGEIPIPVPSTGNSNSATIEYHQFGIHLSLSPTVLSNERIALDIGTEVSDIDTSHALVMNGFNVPAFQKRSATTSVELADGQSFILAGLLYSTTQNVEQRLPGLGDIPIVGTFFKTSSNQRQQQELIVLVTPHLVAPLQSNNLPALPGEALATYKPSTLDMLLNRNTAEDAVARFGLLP